MSAAHVTSDMFNAKFTLLLARLLPVADEAEGESGTFQLSHPQTVNLLKKFEQAAENRQAYLEYLCLSQNLHDAP